MKTDTRSIGQVLFEALHCGAKWSRAGRHDAFERAAEVIYQRGFDAGQANPKQPTPKAKQYRDALREARDAMVAVDLWWEDEEATPADCLAVRTRLDEAITKAEAVLK